MAQQRMKTGRRKSIILATLMSLLVGSAMASAQTFHRGTPFGSVQNTGAMSGAGRLPSGIGPFSPSVPGVIGVGGVNNSFNILGTTNPRVGTFGRNTATGVSTNNLFGTTINNPLVFGMPGLSVPSGPTIFHFNRNGDPNSSSIGNVVNSVSGGQIPFNLANHTTANGGQFPNGANILAPPYTGFQPNLGVSLPPRGFLPRNAVAQPQAFNPSGIAFGQTPASRMLLLQTMQSLQAGGNSSNALIPSLPTNPVFPQQ